MLAYRSRCSPRFPLVRSSSHDGKVVVLDFGHGLDTRHFL